MVLVGELARERDRVGTRGLCCREDAGRRLSRAPAVRESYDHVFVFPGGQGGGSGGVRVAWAGMIRPS
jgi:hypothetical protein